jgi:hypothetical protein
MTALVRITVDHITADPNQPRTRVEVRDEAGALVEAVGTNGTDFLRGRQHTLYGDKVLTIRICHDEPIKPDSQSAIGKKS